MFIYFNLDNFNKEVNRSHDLKITNINLITNEIIPMLENAFEDNDGVNIKTFATGILQLYDDSEFLWKFIKTMFD